jgi:hypothetical protein
MVLFNKLKGEKMKKVLMSVIAMGAIVVSAEAGCASYGCQGLITSLQVTATGNIQVGTDGTETAMNCTPVANSYAELDLSEAGGNAIYSALLTAQTTKKPILIRIVEGSSNCKIAYVKPL